MITYCRRMYINTFKKDMKKVLIVNYFILIFFHLIQSIGRKYRIWWRYLLFDKEHLTTVNKYKIIKKQNIL